MERADNNLAFMLKYENVAWYDKGKVKILDRRIYPMKTQYVTCNNHKEVAKAIADMVTQSGGPYTASSMGMVLAGYECKDMPREKILEYLKDAAFTLSHARPTTVSNMTKIVNSSLDAAQRAIENGDNVVDALFERALTDVNNKYKRYEKVGELLASKFPQNGTVMTQCFGETIIGMMLRACQNQNKNVKFICPETRPYFQGARLTASCICDMGFDVTVITDNMPAYTMKTKNVDVFTSAADVITMDGYVVNKVGTFQIALAASYWGIPYYVTGSPDISHPTIDTVKIEQRDPLLVMDTLGTKTTMEGVKGYYPAFDITPPKLCNGVVTDIGIYPPFNLYAYYDDMKKISDNNSPFCP